MTKKQVINELETILSETLFYLACVLSVILAVLAIVAIALRLELTKETKTKTI